MSARAKTSGLPPAPLSSARRSGPPKGRQTEAPLTSPPDAKSADGLPAEGRRPDGTSADGRPPDETSADGLPAEGRRPDGTSADGRAAFRGTVNLGLGPGADFPPDFPPEIPAEVRLDVYIAGHLRLLTRSQIKARRTRALVNGKPAKLSRAVKNGDLLELFWDEMPPSRVIPEDIPLDILYEDEHVVVVHKRQGMVVHPAAGNHRGTLMNALLFRREKRRGGSAGGSGNAEERREQALTVDKRAFIVHRLDKDTSGVIICAYDDESLRFLAAQFKARSVHKTYYALVNGTPPAPEGVIDTFICRDKHDRKKFACLPPAAQTGGGSPALPPPRGKRAVTRYRILHSWPAARPAARAAAGGCSLLALYPKTGRTHQLRVHLRYLGCPILGDPVYGLKSAAPAGAGATAAAGAVAGAGASGVAAGLMLHAARLTILLPGAAAPSVFKAPLPEHFTAVIRRLRAGR